ncbi:MAG TPA: ABC transporter permease subunit [Candidatus Limiplasma sp.]|nr:ABC transporter permease subunit [Candidatus Limiplasma sp.]HPS81785.1 ABC transporter permease subunit [Candidatus Limiplasma sp.]
MNTVIQRFRSCRLSVKIIAMFSFVLLLTTALMFTVFSVEQNNLRYAEFNSIAQQNTQLIANNIDAMLINANYVTKMIITNLSVQEILVDHRSFNSTSVMQVLRSLLASVTNLQPHTSGVYLFNTIGQRYGMDNYTLHTFSFKQLENAPWYPDALAQNGYYILRMNAGENTRLYGDENVISMIRLMALILPYTGFAIPMAIMIIAGFIEGIPRELEEAGCIDGANIYQIFFRIIFPILMPAVATVMIFTFLQSWNELLFAQIFISKENVKTLTAGIQSMYGQYQTDWGPIGAALVVATFPTLAIYLAMSGQVQKSLAAGAVKG